MARKNRKSERMKIVKNSPPILPFDIVENILSRLPVKSLLRFKSVSKPWYSLISDPKFARFHLHQSKKNSEYKTIFLIGYTDQGNDVLKISNQYLQLEALEFPLKKYPQADVLCSCDGLVVLKIMNDNPLPRRVEMFVIWNPSTRTYTSFSCPYKYDFRTYGLCYDASNDDYKFFLLIRGNRYAIFSYKNNSWIEKNDFSFARLSMLAPGLYANGALHWAAKVYPKGYTILGIERGQDCTDSGYNEDVNYPVYVCSDMYVSELCCFDSKDDKLKMLSKPANFDINAEFQLTDLGGQLCLYRNSYDYTMVEIWMMKNYGDCNSWTKLLTIENVPLRFSSGNYVDILFLTNEGNIILDIYGSDIVVYNPKEKKFCKINVSSEKCYSLVQRSLLSPALCWNDSLVLPSKIDRTKKRKQSGQSEMWELE